MFAIGFFFFYIFETLTRGVPNHGLRSYPLNLMQFALPKGHFHDSIRPGSLSRSKVADMEIIINNQKKDIPDQTTINGLVAWMEMENSTGIAVAVNKKVVPRGSWASTRLSARDEVLLIRASQGG